MFSIDFTFLWAAVSLAIIYFVVRKFLFGKLGGFMDERSASIAADIDKGETLMREGEEFRRKQQEILDEAYHERNKIIEEARLKAADTYDRIIGEAKKDAQNIISQARAEGEREQERLYSALQQEIVSVALSAASKIIEANMDNDRNRELVDKFLASEGAA